ncbi:30S ribosomal protein S19 [Candidatus Woesearchaeota archaeon]|nr:30S ribosomal protein S19 [Candidatus Woesearchaeota archaeon]
MPKEFSYHGKTFDEIKRMNIDEFAQLLPSRERRKLLKGLTEQEKKFLETTKQNKTKLRTHCREIVITPEMVGKIIHVHNGKDFLPVMVEKEMLGHRLGEFAQTRKKVLHSAPGIGSTRSSASLSVR